MTRPLRFSLTTPLGSAASYLIYADARNIDAASHSLRYNMIDPMLLKPEYRDRFPKTKLLGDGHLGDAYPLCSELPPQHYLKKGAKYRYHGPISMFGATHDNVLKIPNIRDHFIPDPQNSQLYALLCGKKNGKCTYPSTVTLDNDLKCNGDVECGADILRAVKVVDGDVWGFYTYVTIHVYTSLMTNCCVLSLALHLFVFHTDVCPMVWLVMPSGTWSHLAPGCSSLVKGRRQ